MYDISCIYTGYEQMISEPTHIDEGVLDLMLTDIPDAIGVRVDSPVGTSDHSVMFIDVLMEKPIPRLVYR